MTWDGFVDIALSSFFNSSLHPLYPPRCICKKNFCSFFLQPAIITNGGKAKKHGKIKKQKLGDFKISCPSNKKKS